MHAASADSAAQTHSARSRLPRAAVVAPPAPRDMSAMNSSQGPRFNLYHYSVLRIIVHCASRKLWGVQGWNDAFSPHVLADTKATA
jgi:hypothetical protein